MNVAGIEIKRGGLVNSFRVVISVKLLRRFVFLQNQLLNSKFERIFIRCNDILRYSRSNTFVCSISDNFRIF